MDICWIDLVNRQATTIVQLVHLLKGTAAVVVFLVAERYLNDTEHPADSIQPQPFLYNNQIKQLAAGCWRCREYQADSFDMWGATLLQINA